MTLQPVQPLIAFALAAVTAVSCYRGKLLTSGGALAATVVGGAVLACGSWPAAAALLAFFFTSSLLGRWRKRVKAALDFEKGGRRDAWQVFANGGLPTLLIAASALFPDHRSVFTVGFLAGLAEANADTWATEIGAASGAAPRMITTLKRAPAGRSGAISLPGTAAAAAASALIALFSLEFPAARPSLGLWTLIAASGFIGALIDSVLGATIQAQYLSEDGRIVENPSDSSRLAGGFAGFNNDLVNFLAAAGAAVIAMAAYHCFWTH